MHPTLLRPRHAQAIPSAPSPDTPKSSFLAIVFEFLVKTMVGSTAETLCVLKRGDETEYDVEDEGDTTQTPTGGSSREIFAIGERLAEQCCVKGTGLWPKPTSQQKLHWAKPTSVEKLLWPKPNSQQKLHWAKPTSQQKLLWPKPTSQLKLHWAKPTSQQKLLWPKPTSQQKLHWAS
ncbi:hypothetical protein Lal_00000234 [Lupinus albus]|nr:hypothetical protein Lal_00000234 [Lupinus albus]